MKSRDLVVALFAMFGIYASSSLAGPLAGKVFSKTHSFRFGEDGKVSEVVNGNTVRTCTYSIDDEDDFDGEGVILQFTCNGKTHQYILNEEHGILSSGNGQTQFALVE